LEVLSDERGAGLLSKEGAVVFAAMVAESCRYVLRRSRAVLLLIRRGYEKSQFLFFPGDDELDL
jgi:hypothetical protein